MRILQQLSKPSAPVLGWPYRDLLHEPDEVRTHTREAIIEATLVFGWVWMVVGLSERQTPEGLGSLLLICGFLITIAALHRLAVLAPTLCSHACVGKRIRERRLILPHHDQLVLPSLLMIAVGWSIPPILWGIFGLPMSLSLATASALAIWVRRGTGPSSQELHLTGWHSKVGAHMPARDFVSTSGH